MALFTPEDVYHAGVEAVWQIRQATMDRHYAEHPERYVNGPPRLARPPSRVAINPDDGQPAIAALLSTTSFALVPTEVSLGLPEVVT